jgi:hypothetical protein
MVWQHLVKKATLPDKLDNLGHMNRRVCEATIHVTLNRGSTSP